MLLPAVHCPVSPPCAEGWIVALVGLHDLGKASPGFQVKLGRSHLDTYRLELDQPDRHDIGTAVLLRDGLKTRGVSPGTAAWLSHAVAAHHGHPFTSHEIRNWAWDPSPAWTQIHQDLIQGVITGTSATGEPELPVDPIDRSPHTRDGPLDKRLVKPVVSFSPHTRDSSCSPLTRRRCHSAAEGARQPLGGAGCRYLRSRPIPRTREQTQPRQSV